MEDGMSRKWFYDFSAACHGKQEDSTGCDVHNSKYSVTYGFFSLKDPRPFW
jgi:hypothetical protein